jgi:N-acetylglutamate synthase/N-acetylornithine aminotransferase
MLGLVVLLTTACRGDAHDGKRCTLRVTPDALYLDGAKSTRDAAVAACKAHGAATVAVEDKAQWSELRAALEAVGVTIHERGVVSD